MQGHFAKVAGVYREIPGIIKLFRQLLNWVFRLLGWPAMGGAELLHAPHIIPRVADIDLFHASEDALEMGERHPYKQPFALLRWAPFDPVQTNARE